MRVPRLLLLSLLISLCVATVAAQSPSGKGPDSSQPASAEPRNAETGAVLFQLPMSFLVDLQSQSDSTADANPAEPNSLVVRARSDFQHFLTLEQNEATCYTLRTYRVARVSPDTDSTRPAGYSTCQPATRFQLRTAVDSREITPR